MPGPWDSIFQQLIELEACPEGCIIPLMFYHRASMLTNIPKIHVYSFKTLDARVSGLHFQHLIEPEACPEGGIKIYQ